MHKEVVSARLEELWPIMEEQINAGGAVKFGPKGTSMLPMIRQGIDSVEIKKAPARLKKYDLPLYRRKNGQFVLHRVIAVGTDGYRMRGDNQTASEHGVTHGQILAIVTGFWRGEEYVSIGDAEYRRYCRRQVRRQSLRGSIFWRALRNAKRIISGK